MTGKMYNEQNLSESGRFLNEICEQLRKYLYYIIFLPVRVIFPGGKIYWLFVNF